MTVYKIHRLFILILTITLHLCQSDPVPAQTTSKYTLRLQSKTTGQLVVGKDVDLYQSGVKKYDLTEVEPGVYSHSAVTTGEYDVYVNGNALTAYSGIFIGAKKIKTVEDQFTSAGKLVVSTALPDSQIARKHLTQTVNVLLDASGSGSAYPPDDEGVEFKIVGLDTSIGIKDVYMNARISDTLQTLFAADSNALNNLNAAEGRIAYLEKYDAGGKGAGLFQKKISHGYNGHSGIVAIGDWVRYEVLNGQPIYGWGLIEDDSTAASSNTIILQALSDAAYDLTPSTNSTRNRIVLPSGYFWFTKQTGKDYVCNVHSAVTISGAISASGGQGTYFKLRASQSASGDTLHFFVDRNYAIQYLGESGSVDYWHQGAIKDLTLNLNGNNQDGLVCGISIYRPGEVSLIENIFIQGFKGWGVYAESGATTRIEGISAFPANPKADTTDYGERSGIVIKGGNGTINNISGDKLWPLLYFDGGSPFFSVTGLKWESGGTIIPPHFGEVVLLDSVSNISRITLNSVNCNMGENSRIPKQAIIRTRGSGGGQKPNLTVNDIQGSAGGQDYIYYSDLGGSLDSITGTINGFQISTNNYEYSNITLRYQSPIKAYDHLGNIITIMQYQSDQVFDIRAPRNTFLFEAYDGTDYFKMQADQSFLYKPVNFQGSARANAGIYVGGTGMTLIDSMAVDTDSLYIYTGSSWKSVPINASDGP